MNMRSLHPLIALGLLVLVGCSTRTITTAPTAEEAQDAINSEPSDMAVAGHKAPQIYVTDVKVGECKSSTVNALIVCQTSFSFRGDPVNTRVEYWRSPNPRHPWRARFIPQHTTGGR